VGNRWMGLRSCEREGLAESVSPEQNPRQEAVVQKSKASCQNAVEAEAGSGACELQARKFEMAAAAT
jgi:hypothetical protein